MLERAVVVVGLWLVACSPPPEPASAAAVDSQPASPATVAAPPEPAPSAEPAPPVAEPAPPPVESKPAAASIRDVCLAMCDKVKAKCPKSAFDSCRVNCGKYEAHAEGCDGLVRSALECARDAADLVCANVAPESCAKSFRQMSACNSGQKPVAGSEPVAAGLPSGFSIYENSAEGVRAPMPEGAAAGEGGTLASVRHADGATYSIRKLPRPAGKLNEKVFLKIAMNLFGRCSDKMKMQGMVDKPGRTSIHFTTKCPDGSEEHGLFWATEKVLFLASAKGPAGKLGPTDAFLYGFEAK